MQLDNTTQDKSHRYGGTESEVEIRADEKIKATHMP